MSTLIDLRRIDPGPSHSIDGLAALLGQLIGEPFQFARFSYGDELTLHFGDVRLSDFTKLKDRRYGTYVLGFRASPWVVKSGSDPLVHVTSEDIGPPNAPFGIPWNQAAIGFGEVIRSRSRVIEATPFVVEQNRVIALRLATSDASSILILPRPDDSDIVQPGESPLADWELSTPAGLVSVGPDLDWSFQPRETASAISSERNATDSA